MHVPASVPTQLPHICFVAPEAWPVLSGDSRIEVIGGAEVQQCVLARALVRNGYRVSMICLDYGQPARATVDGITVIRSYPPRSGIPVLRFMHPRLTMMWRAMKIANADVYYQRGASMLTGVMASFCRRHGKHSVFAGASNLDFAPDQPLLRFRRDRWLFARGIAAVDRIVVQNPAQQRDCLAHYGRGSILIRSCYDLPADARPGSGDYALWVGTLRHDKCPELFLELARRLPHRRFVIVGGADANDPRGGAYYEALRAEASTLPNLEFAGFLPLREVEPRFDRARLVVNTSASEGMPNVFLQAWARGIPTLAFIDLGARLQGAPLYRVAEDVDAAATEAERLFVDDVYWRTKSSVCRTYFDQNHSPASVLAKYAELLKGLP